TRVDGNRVQEIALREGMRIELGQTTLEFHGGGAAAGGGFDEFEEDEGERTRMADMAALEIDPDWEARRARQLGHDAAPTAAQPAPSMTRTHAASPGPGGKKKGGAGKTIAIVSGL